MSTTHRSDGPLLTGYHHSGDRGLGEVGAEIPGTGTHGPALPYPTLQHPADDGKEVMCRVLTVPPLLTLFSVDELGRVTAEGPDGLHTGLMEVLLDGELTTPPTAPFYVAIGAAALSGSVTGDAGTPAGVLSTTPPGSLDGAVTGGDGAPSGTLGGYVEPIAPIGQRVVVVGNGWAPKHLAPLDVGEVDDIAFRFASTLLPGEWVLGYVSTAEARVGVDLNPTPLRDGEAQAYGRDALQRVSGALGVVGVTYLIRVIATLNSGRTVLGSAFLKVERRGVV